MDICNNDNNVAAGRNEVIKTETGFRNKRIPQLEALRFVMCIVIVVSHFEFLDDSTVVGSFYKQYIHNPTLAVNYFFVISGFGMFLSTNRSPVNLKDSLVFAYKKVRGIYVAYIISLAIGSIYYIASRNEGLIEAIVKMLAYFFIDVCFLQSLSGMSVVTNSLNGVCWFISSLFFCYLLSPLMLRLCDVMKKKSIKMCIIGFWSGVLALFIISKIAMHIDSLRLLGGMVDNFSYSHPFVRVWYVFLGMMTGVLFEKTECKWGSLMEMFCTIIVLFYFVCGNSIRNAIAETPILDDMFTIVSFVLPCYLIFVFAKGKGRVSNLLSKFSFLGGGDFLCYLSVPLPHKDDDGLDFC